METNTWLLLALHLALSIPSAIHALLNKHDCRSAFGWCAVCLGYPIIGSCIYFVFGINRMQKRAISRVNLDEVFSPDECDIQSNKHKTTIQINDRFKGLSRLAGIISNHNLVGGNAIDIYHNGDSAYPAMLKAINEAKKHIYLTTYIFMTDNTGKAFIDALKQAHQRGVMVKVLLDGVGEYYAFPHPSRVLKKAGVPFARFHQPRLIPFSMHINMRNHRKILVIDSDIAFTGGMNIGEGNVLQSEQSKKKIVDIHFKLQGPVVHQIEDAFIDDWYAVTNETIKAKRDKSPHVGESYCRTIEDGPNERLSKISLLLTSAASLAEESIWIMTPYFLPFNELLTALQAAALRGVKVTLVLPERNNLPFVDWATKHILPRLLEYDIEVYYRSGPFSHSKLFVVDDYFCHVGSANLDVRSLRLNFELGVEIYNQNLAKTLVNHFQEAIQESTRYTTEDFSRQWLITKLRNSIFWLFSPYL